MSPGSLFRIVSSPGRSEVHVPLISVVGEGGERVTDTDLRKTAATVRTHLLELFAVVGQHDERVRKARGSLMSALF